MGKKSRHLQSEKPCPSLLPQSLCLSLSSCLFPLAQTGLFPADPEIAPLLQIHSALTRTPVSLGISPVLLPHPHQLPCPSLAPTLRISCLPLPTFAKPPWDSLMKSRGLGNECTPNSKRRVTTNLLRGKESKLCDLPCHHTAPSRIPVSDSKEIAFSHSFIAFFRSKNSLQFYLMKDTFMNNQMILIKILLKDVKTSYLPTTEVVLSPCPLSPWLSVERAPVVTSFLGGG